MKKIKESMNIYQSTTSRENDYEIYDLEQENNGFQEDSDDEPMEEEVEYDEQFQEGNPTEYNEDTGGEFRYENGEFLYEDEVRMAKSTWNHMKDSFDLIGEPGISYHIRVSDCETEVRHLEKRDSEGFLLGYIRYWPEDCWDAEKGQIDIMVDPKHWRQGIGTELLKSALEIWPIDLNAQSFSVFGRKFFAAILKSQANDRSIKIEP